MLVGLERFGQFGELGSDFASDFGAAAGRVEREGIGPDGVEQLANVGVG